MTSEETSKRRIQTLLNHMIQQPPSTSPLVQHDHHHDASSSSPLLSSSNTCGIIAFVSDSEPSFDYLMDGLTILQNRGYDSAGICTIDESTTTTITTTNNTSSNGDDIGDDIGSSGSSGSSVLVSSKYASKRTTSDALDLLKNMNQVHRNHRIGIGHTRWATHGAKTDKNAHPHMDYKQRIALVHNGVIENSQELKRMIHQKYPHVRFESETDTEVIVQLLSINYDLISRSHTSSSASSASSSRSNHVKQRNQWFVDALIQTLNQLEGTWGLVILTTLYQSPSLSSNRSTSSGSGGGSGGGGSTSSSPHNNNNNSNPNCLIAVRNGSPMLIGLCNNENRMFISSESSAFITHTREMISLNNGELAIVSSHGIQELIQYNNDKDIMNMNNNVNDRIVQLKSGSGSGGGGGSSSSMLSPDPYPHWTLKEILEQPEAVSRSLNFGGRILNETNVKLGGLDDNAHFLTNIQHLVIAACGTSYYAALYGAKLMRQFKCFHTIRVVDAAELGMDDLAGWNVVGGGDSVVTGASSAASGASGGIGGGASSDASNEAMNSTTGLLVISQSGETSDVMRCLNLAQQMQIPTFSIVNKVDSLIAKTTSCGVYINAGREHAVASTKAFTCQITVLSLVTLWFAEKRTRTAQTLTQMRQQMVSSLHRLPTSIGMLCSEHNKMRNLCARIARNDLLNTRDMFLLGKGFGESIALEGALKIKEITYTHAEAYSSGALKHGPFALIEEGTPIFVIALNDMHLNLNLTAIHEVKARGAKVFAITDLDGSTREDKLGHICHQIIPIPNNGLLTALLAVVPLQLIAYELAVARGIDVDRPRNLAKSVTVL